MSKAISGVGTKFRRWDGTKWVDIAEISHIGGPDKTRSTIDVTSLDSTGGYMEFIAGIRDAGNAALTMNFTREGYDMMNDDFESDDFQNYEMLFPDADETSFEFEGLVTELPLDVPYDDKIGMDVNIKISGKVNVNSGSGSAI